MLFSTNGHLKLFTAEGRLAENCKKNVAFLEEWIFRLPSFTDTAMVMKSWIKLVLAQDHFNSQFHGHDFGYIFWKCALVLPIVYCVLCWLFFSIQAACCSKHFENALHCETEQQTGFPCILQSPGLIFQTLEIPGKSVWSWKVQEIKSLRRWKVLENEDPG